MAQARFKAAISNVVPQIVFCLMMLGFSAHFTITQHMLLGKVCLSQYDKEVCNDLSQHAEAENAVQAETTRLNTNIQLLSMLPAGFITLILGPLSDIYGRKRIILIPTVTTVILAVSLLYQSLSPEISTSVLYLGALLSGLGGGIGAIMSNMINYVTDITPVEHRTEKLSAVLPFFMVGQTLGGLSSGMIAEYIGTSSVYVMFLAATILTVFVIVVFMEDRGDVSTEVGKQSLSLQMVYGNLTAGGKALVAPRPGTRRLQLILLTFVTAVLCLMCMAADMTILPLYVSRAPLSWHPVTLSYQNTLKTIMITVGQVVLTPTLLKVTGKGIIGDFTLVSLGIVAGGVASVVHALAESTWIMMTVVPVIMLLVGPGQPATSSLTSKLVLPSETGALTAFCSFLNSLSIPIGTVIFGMLYSNTIQTIPSATFLTTGVLNFVGAVLIWIARSYAIYDLKKTSEDRKES